MTPEYWEQATKELVKNDQVMGNLILGIKGTMLHSHGDAFTTLARSIVSQQISVKAAESVWHRLIVSVPEMIPKAVYNLENDVVEAVVYHREKQIICRIYHCIL